MKLLTLNAHAWMEENQHDKLKQLAAFIDEQQFDVIALQEVNQSIEETPLTTEDLVTYYSADPEVVIKRDNYAFVLNGLLSDAYHWTWTPAHVGFAKYDEGLAILSKTPITATVSEYVSSIQDYDNYRSRKIVGIQTVVDGVQSWFVSGHYNWWNDEESFRGLWDRTTELLDPLAPAPVFVMGDFNNAAEVRGEGYDYVMQSGWSDTYSNAAVRDAGHTVIKAIVGWESNAEPLRIDYVFCSKAVQVQSSTVVLNGKTGPVVSDHFGVAVELEL
ncbi:exodeoxyribonuclease III [Paenibacillus jamilae]|uniref:endonuclease/exonuclease/phosphatase family protein n=1 Tax=Paenibacillus jamilae TaxID=114136 RepID=UPI0007AB6A06|nr:endonuclease/exonuclease/phosphatase family protein [Paenibacillus jamilae]KZE82647.1 exodeoxyribonuclease III [Paenibacillus jamilae]